MQRRLQANKRAPARSKADVAYLLSCKLYCGYCGSVMTGECGTSGTKGVRYYYYKCSSAKKHKGCHRKAVKNAWIEELGVRVPAQNILTSQAIAKIAKQMIEYLNQYNPVLPSLKIQAADIQKKIENIIKAVETECVI